MRRSALFKQSFLCNALGMQCCCQAHQLEMLQPQESWTRVSPQPPMDGRSHYVADTNASSATSQGSASQHRFVESDYNPEETSFAARIAAEAEAEMRNRGFRGKIKSVLHKDSH